MQSLQQTSSGYVLQFTHAGKRRTLRLGKISDGSANRWASRIEQMRDEWRLDGQLSAYSRGAGVSDARGGSNGGAEWALRDSTPSANPRKRLAALQIATHARRRKTLARLYHRVKGGGR